MFCKWCGLESETTDVCSWCRQPFTTSTDSPSPSPPEPAESEVTAEPIEVSPVQQFVEEALPSAAAPLAGPSDIDDDLPPIARAIPPPLPPTQAPTDIGKAFGPTGTQAPEERPDLQAIPIKRAPGGGPPPPVSPISTPPAPSVNPPQIPSVAPAMPPSAQPAYRAPLAESAPESSLSAPTPVDRTPQPLGDILEDEPQIGAAPMRPTGTVESPARGAQRAAPSAQPSTTGTATATRTATRVYCRWCGMESETADICSWCRKDVAIKPLPRPVEALKRGPQPVKKGPQRKEIKPPPAAPAEGNGNGIAAGVPAIGTFTAQKSRYYPEKVYDPVSGAHYDADTGVAEVLPQLGEEYDRDTEPIYPLNQLAINLAILIGLAVLGALTVQRNPEWYLSLLGVTNFAAGMIMPILRTVPFGDDDSTDIGVVIALILILGPLVGAILYFFYCFVKQDFSPGMVGVFVSYLVLRLALDAVLGIPIAKIMPWYEFTPETIGAQIMPFVTIAGWYAADVFHKPDE